MNHNLLELVFNYSNIRNKVKLYTSSKTLSNTLTQRKKNIFLYKCSTYKRFLTIGYTHKNLNYLL